MNSYTFIKSFNRLPTPSECATQIELLNRDVRELYLIGAQMEPQTAEEIAKRDKYQEEYLERRRLTRDITIRYEYISAALKAGVPEDHIRITVKFKPPVPAHRRLAYYTSLIEQIKVLDSERIYPAY